MSSSSSNSRLWNMHQRLLLLRHASQCTHIDYDSNSPCPVTKMCGGLRKLLRHISDCKDQRCKVEHCGSSRLVIDHFRHCKDIQCRICEPVRDVIRHSQAKAEAEARANSTPDEKAVAASHYEAQLLNTLLQKISSPDNTSAVGSSSSGQDALDPSYDYGRQLSVEQPPNKRARKMGGAETATANIAPDDGSASKKEAKCSNKGRTTESISAESSTSVASTKGGRGEKCEVNSDDQYEEGYLYLLFPDDPVNSVMKIKLPSESTGQEFESSSPQSVMHDPMRNCSSLKTTQDNMPSKKKRKLQDDK